MVDAQTVMAWEARNPEAGAQIVQGFEGSLQKCGDRYAGGLAMGGGTVDPEDLRQAGRLAILEHAGNRERNATTGPQTMYHALLDEYGCNNGAVYVPPGPAEDKILAYRKREAEDQSPTDSELSELLGMRMEGPPIAKKATHAWNVRGLRMTAAVLGAGSLESAVEQNPNLIDMAVDPIADRYVPVGPEEQVVAKEYVDYLLRQAFTPPPMASESLTLALANERAVIELLFGLTGKGERDIKEIAEEMSVPERRIKDLQRRGLWRLKQVVKLTR